MVNPDVDFYTKTQNQRKILQKTQKITNQLKTKIIVKPIYTLRASPVFTITLPGGYSPLSPVMYATVSYVNNRIRRIFFPNATRGIPQ